MRRTLGRAGGPRDGITQLGHDVPMAPVPVHVASEGLPWWQQVLLTILGCAIAFGLLALAARLLPKNRGRRRNKP